MTALSRSTLVLALGLAGCTTRFKLDPARTPDLVAPYSRSRQSVIYYQGKRYPIRPEQAPELRVTARRPDCQPARGELAPPVMDPPTPATETFSAPLGDVRAEGDILYFPNTRAVRTRELERAELRLPGEPLVALPRSAKDKPRPLSKLNNFAGLQLGGSGVFQGVYRRRILGPLLLDLGGLLWVLPWSVNASAGVVLDVPVSSSWSIYTGGGAGMAFALLGESEEGGATAGIAYLYGRLGVAFRYGPERREQIAVDGGFWSASDSSHHTTLLPMAGLAYLRAF